MSHPVRVRGLKPKGEAHEINRFKSHPVRVRGLKHAESSQVGIAARVAPRAGAWIETASTGL